MFSPRFSIAAEYQFEGIRGLAFGLVDGVDVAVRGLELSMTEAGGHVLDIRAVAQKQGRGSMAEGVEFAVRQVVPLLELTEPQRRRGREHRPAVSLNKNPLVAQPCVAEREAVLTLFGAVFAQHSEAVRRQDERSAPARFGRFAPDFRVARELVITAADRQNACLEINVAPLQSHKLAAPTARIQREVNEQAEHQRFALEGFQHIIKLLLRENLGLLLVEFRQGYALALGGIRADQAEAVGAFHQRANHRVVAADGRGRELAGLAVEVGVALCEVVDETLNVKRADVLQFQMSEGGDNSDVEDVGVALEHIRRKALLGGFEVHRHEVGEFQSAVGADLTVAHLLLKENRLPLNLFLDLFFGHIRLGLVCHRAADLLTIVVVPARHRDEVTVLAF